jgi:ribonuclease R
MELWESAGAHCSANERRADEASRDVEAWLKCRYMRDRLGEEFSGTVTAVTSFGLFVTLDALYVEGLVHITELGGEYFRYDEARQELRGERTGVRYVVGSRVRVQVSRVDLDGRRIDFRLVHEGADTRLVGRRGVQGKMVDGEPRARGRRGRKGGEPARAKGEDFAAAELADMPSADTPPVDRSHATAPMGSGAAADAAETGAEPALSAVDQLQALKEESRAHKAAARTARKTGARKSAARKTAAAKSAAKSAARKSKARG